MIYYFTINKCLALEQQTFSDCRISKRFTYLDTMIQVVTFYNNIQRKWKNLIKHSQESNQEHQEQIDYIITQFQIQTNNKKGLLLRSIYLEYYFISQDESFIISSKLSFYEISTGKIAFEIKLSESEEVLYVKVEDGQIKILTWDNLYIYNQINTKQNKSDFNEKYNLNFINFF